MLRTAGDSTVFDVYPGQETHEIVNLLEGFSTTIVKQEGGWRIEMQANRFTCLHLIALR